jgi:hypothetical protein
MRTISKCLILAALVLATGCKAPSFQQVPRPDEHGPVGPQRCRVYLMRADDLQESLRNVRILDDGVEIGRIGGKEYLCWDRPAKMSVGQAIYEGLDPSYGKVENVFELPREAGTTTWLCVRIGKLKKPEIVPISPEEGRALIAERKPAPTE